MTNYEDIYHVDDTVDNPHMRFSWDGAIMYYIKGNKVHIYHLDESDGFRPGEFYRWYETVDYKPSEFYRYGI